VLGDIRDGIERVSQIVSDLGRFTRDSGRYDEILSLRNVVDQAVRLLSHQFGDDISLEQKIDEKAVVKGNHNQLVQVVINFLQNSIDGIRERVRAGDDGKPGQITVAAARSERGGWDLTVHDNGIGIPPERLNKIFDPFFTSKDVGKGMGLGLSITHHILERHNAVVEVDSQPGKYTLFRVMFPSASTEHTETSPEFPEQTASPEALPH
jgi:signal transduction histidine kinase